jgi:predicted P-loop ATPase
MKIAEARKKTSRKWRTHDITWEQFLSRVRTPLRTGESVREYKAMAKEDRDIAKEAAGGFVAGALEGGQRKTDKVLERSMITLDADHARPNAWEEATCMMENRMCCYSTHSHSPSAPRLRWIIPTDRPMTPDEYPAVARMVASWIGIDQMDPTTYEVARLMYWPTCSADGDYVFREQVGPVLSVDEVLESYGYGDAWTDTALWPMGEAEQTLRHKIRQKAGDPTEKNGIVGLFCRTYDVPAAIDEFLPDIYTEAGDGRYTYAKGTTAGGAVLYDNGAFLFSNHATDPTSGFSCNAFDLVRIHMFGQLDDVSVEDTPVTKLPSYSAMCRFAAELPAVRAQMAAERADDADAMFGDLLTAETAAGAETDQTIPDESWQANLEINAKTGVPESTINNALLIIRGDPLLRGRMGLSELDGRRYVRKTLPWDAENGSKRTYPDLWNDSDDAGLRLYLSRVWGISGRAIIDDALSVAMLQATFHPVREYLKGLTWDGVERVDTLLVRTLLAEDTALTRSVTRKWMVAACKRVFEPGCKFDTMLVLVSPTQGSGKSMFGDTLAGSATGWFMDDIKSIESKDSLQSLRGKWIVEMGEMAATRKSTNEAIKQFIACRTDSYRASYERYTRDYPRQCVFIGSTNTTEFILDETGGRRFWPVEVYATPEDAAVRIRRLAEERDQLWAEAMHYYRQGEKTYLEGDLLTEVLKVQEHNTQTDEWQGWIQAYLDKPLPDKWHELTPEQRRDYIQGDNLMDYGPCNYRRETVTIAEIRYELLGESLIKGAGGGNESSRHLGRVMNVMRGWRVKKSKIQTHFGRQRAYERIPD